MRTVKYSCKCGKSFEVKVVARQGEMPDIQADSCKFCEPPELSFAPIDAKGRDVVGVQGRWCQGGPTGANFRTCLEAELEYLQGLDRLQKEIAAKYGPRLVPQPESEGGGGQEVVDEVYGEEGRCRRFGHLYYT